jgi:hypothetical protein
MKLLDITVEVDHHGRQPERQERQDHEKQKGSGKGGGLTITQTEELLLVSIFAQDGVFNKRSINWDTMVKHTGTTNKRAAKRLFHRFLDKLPELDDDPDEETSDIEAKLPKLLVKKSVDTKSGPKKRKHNPKDDDEGRFTT